MLFSMALEFSTVSDSVRSYRFISQIQSPEITFTCKIWIVTISKNNILYLSDLTDFLHSLVFKLEKIAISFTFV